MRIKFKKLSPYAVVPTRGSMYAAGYDLTAIEVEQITSMKRRVHTGLAVEIPPGFAGFIFPRSSIYKTSASLTNAVGVIDSDYRGEIMAVFFMWSTDMFYKEGERFAQMVILPVPEIEYEEADELSETKRGTGGYGSTGK